MHLAPSLTLVSPYFGMVRLLVLSFSNVVAISHMLDVGYASCLILSPLVRLLHPVPIGSAPITSNLVILCSVASEALP